MKAIIVFLCSLSLALCGSLINDLMPQLNETGVCLQYASVALIFCGAFYFVIKSNEKIDKDKWS